MSIRVKLLIPILLILMFIFTYYHSHLIPSIKKELLEEFITEQEEVANMLKTASQLYVDEHSPSSLNNFLQSKKILHPYWESIEFVPFNSTNDPRTDMEVSLSINKLGSNGIEITIPVRYSDDVAGSIKIISNGTTFVSRHIENVIRLEKPFLFSLIFIALYILYVLQTSVSKPIEKINKTLRSISNQDYGHALEVENKDEIGELASSLEKMRVAVADYQKRIEFKKKLFNEIVDSLDDAILLVDSKNQVFGINPAAQRLFSSFNINAHKLKNVIESFNPIDQNIIQSLLDGDCNKDDYGDFHDSQICVGDTESKSVKYSVKLIIEENERVSVFRIRDISASKKVENQILDQRQQIATINQAQANYIASGDPMELFDGLLPDLLELAESEHGFIAQVVNEGSQPKFLRVFTNLSFPWDSVTTNLSVGDENSILEIHEFDEFIKRIFEYKEPVISNVSANKSTSIVIL